MKARERHSAGAMIAQPDCAVASPTAAPLAVVDGTGPAEVVWEECFRITTAGEREELLRLAEAQGLLYLNQLSNLVKQVGSAAAVRPVSPIVHDLLAGANVSLLPLVPESCAVDDIDLDPTQRQAVARALATPDIFLLQGLPGTGKTRVLVEVITQAARRGQRVLFVAMHAASIDVVLEQLVGREGVYPVRLTAVGEQVPPPVKAMVLEESRRSFRTGLLEKANKRRTESEENCRRHQLHAAVGGQLASLLEAHERKRAQLDSLTRAQRELPGTILERVRNNADPLGQAVDQLHRVLLTQQGACTAVLEELIARQQSVDQELKRLAHEAEKLEPLVRARREGKWWTTAWWRGRFSSNPSVLLDEIELKKHALHQSRTELVCQAWDLEQKRQLAEENFARERTTLLEREKKERRDEFAADSDRLQAEIADIQAEWQSLADSLGLVPAAEISQAGLEQTLTRWHEQKRLDEENCQFARRWLQFLEEEADKLAARFPKLVNLVASTVQTRKQSANDVDDSFDLLVIEDAEQFTEADLLPLAARAQRCLLVAQSLPATMKNAPPTPFQKLWQRWHADPRTLPYRWFQEQGRLGCQLQALLPADHARLESERLADAPDIELRILPGAPPQLAQVLFPTGMTLSEAKSFIYRELQEVPIQSLGRNAWLEEACDRFVWQLECAADTDSEETSPIILADGLTEWLAGANTSRIEFLKSDWPRDRVLDWLARHGPFADSGRTLYLATPHRMQPDLAAWVENLFFPEPASHEVNGNGHGNARPAVVEFVPVPALRLPEGRNGKFPREGAGLEIDLAGGRAPDRIPPEYRAALPRVGFANFLEAQAVVRTLEPLVGLGTEKIGVVAFQPAQVQLLRQLLGRTSWAARVEIGRPHDFRGRECGVLVVSLTRSTTHRNGSLAPEHAEALLALSRARFRLILVGDPGTLLKWHPDADSFKNATRIPCWEAQVCRYLQSRGFHQAAFHLCDGSS